MTSELANGVAISWTNTRVLDENLRNGELNLATAIGQLAAMIRDSLKVIESFAHDNIKLNTERKTRLERMDKLVNDLSEKCQNMQQALLYKEEKYDEKCREVERYKVICELSAKAAINDELFYTPGFESKHNDPAEDNVDLPVARQHELQSRGSYQPSQCSSIEARRNVLTHTKLDHTQSHLRSHVNPLRPETSLSNMNMNFSELTEPQCSAELASKKSATIYVGGPCKRKRSTASSPSQRDVRLQEQLEKIGGINVKGPSTSSGVVPLDKLFRPNNTPEGSKRIRVSLSGQSNEVLSASRNASNQFKQNFTEKNLSRQVARGCWTRLASRRKKEWPF